jgi:hypothetical protein
VAGELGETLPWNGKWQSYFQTFVNQKPAKDALSPVF